MNEKQMVLTTGMSFFIIFMISTYLIEKIQKIKLDLGDNYQIVDLMEQLKGTYQMKGTWIDRKNNINKVIPFFEENQGLTLLRINEYHNLNQVFEQFINTDNTNTKAYLMEIWIFSGYQLSNKKLKLQQYIKDVPPDAKQLYKEMNGYKLILQTEQEKICDFVQGFELKDSKFLKTKLLEDLNISYNFSSGTEGCIMDITSSFYYDNYESNQMVLKFALMAILTGLFDVIMILYMIKRFSIYENLCRSQSVIFWVGMGMLNSLFCFINILSSAIQNKWLSYFMLGTLLHFLCLYQIILKVVHKIGLVTYLDLSDENIGQARRSIAIMHMQIYLVVLLGLIFGLNHFPNKIILISLPFFLLCQVFVIAQQNDRIFPNMSLHLALCLSKFIFCYYSKLTFFKKYGQENEEYFSLSFFLIILVFIVIKMQQIFGPRLFLRQLIQKKQWRYFVKTDSLNAEELESICPICFVPIKDFIIDEEHSLPDLLQGLKDIDHKQEQIMKTPCNHLFHASCLISCMHYKKKCAVCRGDLPNWF